MSGKTAEESGKRLDAWLAESEPGLSRSRWQGLIKNGKVTVNGGSVKSNFKLRSGDFVEWTIPDPVPTETLPENIPLDILFEDRHIIVVNKPAGLVVHPAAGNENGTLVNALLHHCTDLTGIGGEERPGIVHRLDKDTSGVMVIAKTETAMAELARQFKKRETEKEYLAIVRGALHPSSGYIETTIGRHPIHRKKMAANIKRGRRAVSNYKTDEKLKNASLLRIRIETGRTHQIRVHMAFLKHPILGDKLYARRQPTDTWPDRQMLHAAKLSIIHPNTRKKMTFQAPLPADMKALLEQLRINPSEKSQLPYETQSPQTRG
ncbi:RluA family pseudouridine synthase [Tichowtungia aerotolerans]|uniref:Pseudouridine synthase n=1 Tax=Tichowtungia aerotolerans TaxID=2697043 RepID=A0A6P1M4Z5_9BACT|nr:RluA family pseudouridine synthase [Tichowtungia aerotolerans]QHI68073.1 RluA family pseudouridine synthase [Tichowtungia aerotolerans]